TARHRGDGGSSSSLAAAAAAVAPAARRALGAASWGAQMQATVTPTIATPSKRRPTLSHCCAQVAAASLGTSIESCTPTWAVHAVSKPMASKAALMRALSQLGTGRSTRVDKAGGGHY